jgi:hypothetical protein
MPRRRGEVAEVSQRRQQPGKSCLDEIEITRLSVDLVQALAKGRDHALRQSVCFAQCLEELIILRNVPNVFLAVGSRYVDSVAINEVGKHFENGHRNGGAAGGRNA